MTDPRSLHLRPSKTMAKMLFDRPAENNFHAGEEVVVVDNPLATPSTSVDDEAAEDARGEPEMEGFATSYAET